MRIKKLHLKNWRNFREVDMEMGERVFIVGPNASGKSNLLDSIKFLRDISRTGGGLQKAILDRGGLSRIRCLSARQDPTVEIDVTIGEEDRNEWRYRIILKQDPRGYKLPYLVSEEVWHGDVKILNRSETEEKEIDQLSLTETHLEQLSANKNFRELPKFLESSRYLHVVPQLMRSPDAFRGSGQGLPGDPYGLHLLYELNKIQKKTRDSRLKKIESVLKIAVPQMKELSFVIDEQGVPHLETIYQHWRPNGGRQREDQFSDGTLRLIGLMWAILETEPILLLEEPELSLHPGLVKRIPSLMYRLQKIRKKQIISTTHSADLLSDPGIEAKDVFLLAPTGDGTGVIKAADENEIMALLSGGMSIAEAILPRTEPKNMQQLNLFDVVDSD